MGDYYRLCMHRIQVSNKESRFSLYIAPWTQTFIIVNSCGKILLLLQRTGGFIIKSEKRIMQNVFGALKSRINSENSTSTV